MASSLSPTCTPLKHSYDTCFNTWFSSYLLLISPPLLPSSSSSTASASMIEEAQRKRERSIKEKKVELESKCGKQYNEYTLCLKKAIGEKEGLSEMLESARQEEPLAGWGGIRVVTEEDM